MIKHLNMIVWSCSIIGVVIILTALFNCTDIGMSFINEMPESRKSAEAEIHAFFYFLSGVGTILLVLVAYKQILPMSQTAEAEFLLHIDKRWTSLETTSIRQELWYIYRKERKQYIANKFPKSEKVSTSQYLEAKKNAISKVGQYICKIELGTKKKECKKLFELLNFMELMGAIYTMKNRGLISEDLLEQLFGQKLKTYIYFYRKYFEKEFLYQFDDKGQNNCKKYGEICKYPPSVELLRHFDKKDHKEKKISIIGKLLCR